MTNPTQTEIQLDDEVLEQVIGTLKELAYNFDTLADVAEDEADRMADEMKGDNGTIPPIYQDIGEALIATAKRMRKVNEQLVNTIRADARTIRNQLDKQTEVQETGAAIVNSVDTTLA